MDGQREKTATPRNLGLLQAAPSKQAWLDCSRTIMIERISPTAKRRVIAGCIEVYAEVTFRASSLPRYGCATAAKPADARVLAQVSRASVLER